MRERSRRARAKSEERLWSREGVLRVYGGEEAVFAVGRVEVGEREEAGRRAVMVGERWNSREVPFGMGGRVSVGGFPILVDGVLGFGDGFPSFLAVCGVNAIVACFATVDQEGADAS